MRLAEIEREVVRLKFELKEAKLEIAKLERRVVLIEYEASKASMVN